MVHDRPNADGRNAEAYATQTPPRCMKEIPKLEANQNVEAHTLTSTSAASGNGCGVDRLMEDKITNRTISCVINAARVVGHRD